MQKIIGSAIFTALVATMTLAGPAFGQAFDFSFDFNTPAADEPKYSYQAPIDTDGGLGWTFGYFGRGAFAEGGAFRWGVLLGRKTMKVKRWGENEGYKYSVLRIQGTSDLRLWANRNFHLTGGLAAGLAFFGDNIPCNDSFCAWPSAAVEITPNLRLTGRISDGISLFLDARGSLYMSDATATFPYTSGVILAVGVEISAYTGKKSSGDDGEPRGEF